MARLPDRFDLWFRKARECDDPARQVDYVLGALAALSEWHFLNIGTKEKPEPATGEIDGENYLLVFSDVGRIEEIVGKPEPNNGALSVISMPTVAAMTWCLERAADGCAGLLLNPGDYAAAISFPQLAIFHEEWSRRGGRQASGFWIPNLSTEEEDFWQKHGL